MEKKIYLLKAEHEDWLRRISFYRDEIKIFKNRLEEIASKNTGEEVLKGIEQFQNQLIIQTEQLDILAHNIRQHDAAISAEIKENITASDHRKAADHNHSTEDMEQFEKLFIELRNSINRFLAKVF